MCRREGQREVGGSILKRPSPSPTCLDIGSSHRSSQTPGELRPARRPGGAADGMLTARCACAESSRSAIADEYILAGEGQLLGLAARGRV